MSNTLPSQIVVRGQIADASGHTDFAGSIDEAMDLIMNQVTKNGKWVYVNGNPFMFTDHSLTEQNELRNMFTNAAEPTFMLTAKLQGGAAAPKAKLPRVRTQVTKSPLSRIITPRNRAHMAVSVTSKGGQQEIKVMVSDHNGSKKRLAKNRGQIMQAIFDALNG
jgi:hypothetical protein